MKHLTLILTALIIFTGCCPKYIGSTIKDSTVTTVTDSTAIKKLQIAIRFKTDSLKRAYTKQVQLLQTIEAMDSLLWIATNQGCDSAIKYIYTHPRFAAFSGSHYGFGTCNWSMSVTGLFEHIFDYADTTLTDSCDVAERFKTINNVRTVTATNTVVEKEMIWWGWLIIGALIMVIIGLIAKILLTPKK